MEEKIKKVSKTKEKKVSRSTLSPLSHPREQITMSPLCSNGYEHVEPRNLFGNKGNVGKDDNIHAHARAHTCLYGVYLSCCFLLLFHLVLFPFALSSLFVLCVSSLPFAFVISFPSSTHCILSSSLLYFRIQSHPHPTSHPAQADHFQTSFFFNLHFFMLVCFCTLLYRFPQAPFIKRIGTALVICILLADDILCSSVDGIYFFYFKETYPFCISLLGSHHITFCLLSHHYHYFF